MRMLRDEEPGIGEFVVALFAAAYLAVICWVITTWARLLPDWRWARLAWTIGALANLGHVLLAFHLFHEWDHGKAQSAIARQTYEQVGWEWGGGIYVNYAFCTLWIIDAMVWWIAPIRYLCRSIWCSAGVQFTCLFMFVNATIVFGKSDLRFLGAALCLLGTVGFVQTRKALSR
jgi:hypothetical protein